jgi:ketosteroid isomerase-like protein
MTRDTQKPRSRKWLFLTLAGLVILGAAFAGGVWFAGRGERAVEAVTDAYSAVYAGQDSTKDVPDLLSLYADDAVLRDAAADRTHQGTAEIENALNTLMATPDFDLTIDEVLVGDDWALVSWTANGTRPDSGRLAQVSGVASLEISGSLIERETWHYDPAKAPF